MDVKSYHQIWNDTWQFFKRYMIDMPMTEEGWDQVIREMSEYVEASPHERMAREIIIAAFHELEAEYKRRK